MTDCVAAYPEVQRPDRPRGTYEQQISQLFDYLWQLSETLEIIINAITREKGEKNNGDK